MTHVGSLTRQARAAGLLLSEEAVRDAAQVVAEELTNADDLRAVCQALKARAISDGDVAAFRAWMDRAFGGVPQAVAVDQTSEQRIVVEYGDEGRPE